MSTTFSSIGNEPRTRAGAPLGRGEALVLLGALGVLVAIVLPEIGSDPWPFRAPPAEARGLLGPLVRLAGGEWDPALLRAAVTLAGLVIALAAMLVLVRRRLERSLAVAAAALVVALLVLPGVLLQVGLRYGTAPWFHDNDSTYQIDISGELVRDGRTPYGHDYRFSGLERFYSLDGSVRPGTREQQVALRHFAYFPGTPLSAAAWGLVPVPFDDYRVLVALLTLAALPAALLFPGPLGPRLALGAALAANPLAIRAAWFGTADAASLLALVVAFALALRARVVFAAAALAAAVLLKQFAVVALPFLAVVAARRASRRTLVRAAGAFALVLLAGFLPFAVADLRALAEDTIVYGGASYRVIGYGLAGILLELGVIEDRFGSYPFGLLAALVWLPVTALLVRAQLRSSADWTAAAALAASLFVLFFIGRVFQTSYVGWCLAGILLAGLMALAERERLAQLGLASPGADDTERHAARGSA